VKGQLSADMLAIKGGLSLKNRQEAVRHKGISGEVRVFRNGW
jgi:hypothetical protein